MNILYTAFSISYGKGGHIRSMKQVFDEFNRNQNCVVLIFGQIESTIFNSVENTFFINVLNKSYSQIRKTIKYIIKKNNINVIHSFDEFSYMFCQFSTTLPQVLTRCGGPNPKRYPFVKNLTCFSLENPDS